MTLIVRVYRTEKNAAAADKALAKAGFTDRFVFHAAAHKGSERAAVRSAIEKRQLPENMPLGCTHALQQGNSLVSVEAPFGAGHDAITIMESVGGVDRHRLTGYVPDNPAPFSSAFGLPSISRSAPATQLVDSSWSLSSVFGMGLLSNKPAPLSSMFGLKTLTERKREWKSSFGLPLISRKPAPLSALFAMPTVTRRKRDWNWSFGMPLLSNNPAPLSSLLGWRTLSKKR